MRRMTTNPLRRKTSQKGNLQPYKALLPLSTPFPTPPETSTPRDTALLALRLHLPGAQQDLRNGFPRKQSAENCTCSLLLRCPDFRRLWWQKINLSKLLHLDSQGRGLRDNFKEEIVSFKMPTLLSNNWPESLANNQNRKICAFKNANKAYKYS